MLTIDYVLVKSQSALNSGLHPKIKEMATELIKQSYLAGVPILLTQGYRSKEYQDQLYAQGRTKLYDANGKKLSIVTNAKGGSSMHNYGLAVDFALLLPSGTSASWDTTRDGDGDNVRDWAEVVNIGKKIGFEWGGDWKGFVDMPHFQYTFGLTLKQLQAGKRPPIEEEITMKKADADKVIVSLQKLWSQAKTQAEKDEYHRQADAVRDAAGIKK
ncbi:M15 family metallopeptidase [Paenibacillus sp. MMO-177]|uniref:M15 family metallopeptidase n=1 Tax=Paenibacillus sp. MMO-177 TaxID=3081289 RepID=UPI003016A621